MKLQILQQDLLPVVSAISRSVGIKSTLPVLSNILLSTEDGKLKLAATNLEIGVIKYVSANISEAGDITVPAKTLLELLSSLGPTELTLESQGDLLSIKAQKFSSQINGIPASEFPVIPVSSDQTITLEADILKDYGRVMFAASADGGRALLTGVLTSIHQGKLDLVATDGFRLAHRQVILAGEKSSFKTLIPKKTLEEVLRIIDEDLPTGKAGLKGEEKVLVATSSSQNQIIFQVGLTTISSRLIEGNFPAWEKIIPTEHQTRIIIDQALFYQAVKLAAIFARNEANIVTVDITQDKLTVSSETKEIGQQTNELDCQVEGVPLKIAFSAKFLTEAIANVASSSLSMELTNPLSPALVKPIGVEGLEYIIMPVRQS